MKVTLEEAAATFRSMAVKEPVTSEYREPMLPVPLTEKVTEYTTGEDGKILMYGLSYGTYYIVETKAPKDYNLLNEPVTVQIHETSHLDEAVLTVYNTRFLLPETGGMGTGLFTVFGIICIGGALVISACCLRKKET